MVGTANSCNDARGSAFLVFLGNFVTRVQFRNDISHGNSVAADSHYNHRNNR
jgi:hypothetical protein